MVANEVYRTPIAITLALALSMNKKFLSHHLFNKDGNGAMEILKGEKLDQMLLKFVPLCSPKIRNVIASLKHCPNNFGSIDCILKLKALFGYDYIQDNCFPNQQVGQKLYLFKMFVNGAMSRFDLVRQMQPSDDMLNAWMMFDHVKCVQGGTTMACHVYDMVYYKVMTIAIYDMQFRDIES